jgi:transcriptional regulator with GAF, ATPase, and Fis domain
VLLFNRGTGELEPAAYHNLDEQGPEHSHIWKLTASSVLETKAPQVIANLQADKRVSKPEFFKQRGLVSYVGLPLTANDEILGVLSVFTKDEHPFSEEEVEFLSLFVVQASAGIHRCQIHEQSLSRLADLEKENKLKDQFLGALSSELRTPLNSVMGYAGIIRDKMLGEINPKQDDALAGVMRSCEDQLKAINSILEVAKIEALKDQVLKGPRPLSEAVDEFERDLIVRALEKTGSTQTKAASLLGMTRRMLRYKMEKLKIRGG